MGLRWAFCVLSSMLVYSLSRAQFTPDLSTAQCRDGADPLDESSFQFDYTVEQNADATWSLQYTITWGAASCSGCLAYVYIANLAFESRDTTIESWDFTECDDALAAAGKSDDYETLTSPTLQASAPFTHRALLKVIYGGLTAVLPVTTASVAPATNIFFETPARVAGGCPHGGEATDCYEATGDIGFCSSQEVHRCGPPRDVALVEATDTYGTITLTFRWDAPVQVNSNAELHEYTTQIMTTEEEMLILSGQVPAGADETTWEAVIPDHTFEEGTNYIIVVVPYVVDSREGTPAPGRQVSHVFTVQSIRYYTTDSSQGEPDHTKDSGGGDPSEEYTTDSGEDESDRGDTGGRGMQANSTDDPSTDTPGGSVSLMTIIIVIIVIVVVSIVASLALCLILSCVKRRGSTTTGDVNMDRL